MVGQQLTQAQRVFIVETYNRTHSFRDVQEGFRDNFPDRNIPTKSTIFYNVRKFHEHGSCSNLNQYRSGRRRSARTAENIELVRNILRHNPHVSVRRNGSGLSPAAFNRITRLDLNYHPYVLNTHQELREGDFIRRQNFSRWLLNKFEENDFLGKIIIGDEAAFQMNGSVNTHNVREYSPRGQHPNFNYAIPESREKVTVWAALCGNGCILGPHFFDANMNADRYLNMINDFLWYQK